MKPPRTFWTPEEDARLIAFVEEHGRSCETFRKAIAVLPHRHPKCMESRYLRYLDPQRKTAGEWTEEEDAHLLSCFAANLGIRKVVQSMPHRTRGQISCRYMTLRRRQKRAAATAGSVAAAETRARRAEEAEQTKTEEEALPPVQAPPSPELVPETVDFFDVWNLGAIPLNMMTTTDPPSPATVEHFAFPTDDQWTSLPTLKPFGSAGTFTLTTQETLTPPPKVKHKKTTLLHHFGVVRSGGHPFQALNTMINAPPLKPPDPSDPDVSPAVLVRRTKSRMSKRQLFDAFGEATMVAELARRSRNSQNAKKRRTLAPPVDAPAS